MKPWSWPWKRRLRPETLRVAAVIWVAVLHIGVFVFLNRTPAPGPVAVLPPPLNVILADLAPLASDPPMTPETASSQGGAPAAPSRVRPTVTPDRPPEVVAPPAPAPEPTLTVGAAPDDSGRPGQGRGQGPGEGDGPGAGQGEGAGQPPRLLTGPTISQIRALHPRVALMARRGGRGVIACRIRLDTRLEACRLVEETPPGEGFGRAALQAAPYFRFRPPAGADGAPLAGHEVTFGLDFGPPRAEAPDPRR